MSDTTIDTPAADMGDAGKKALDAMKVERNAARDRVKELEAALAKLNGETPPAEKPEDKPTESDDAPADDSEKADDVEGVTADGAPADDMAAQIKAAVAAALADMTAEKAPRFQGTADSGAARQAAGPSQLTREDLKGMTPEQVNAAKKNGQLRDLLSGK
jgi:hypothetical protein